MNIAAVLPIPNTTPPITVSIPEHAATMKAIGISVPITPKKMTPRIANRVMVLYRALSNTATNPPHEPCRVVYGYHH